MTISITIDLPAGVIGKIDTIITLLTALRAEGKTMNAALQAEFDKLAATVAQEKTVIGSAKTLFEGLSAKIAALKDTTNDPTVIAAIDGLTASVNDNVGALSAAITANTPAA